MKAAWLLQWHIDATFRCKDFTVNSETQINRSQKKMQAETVQCGEMDEALMFLRADVKNEPCEANP